MIHEQQKNEILQSIEQLVTTVKAIGGDYSEVAKINKKDLSRLSETIKIAEHFAKTIVDREQNSIEYA